MSRDVYVVAPGCCVSHGHQFTGNYYPALQAAGLPSWSMLDQLPAPVVHTLVHRVIVILQKDPARYGALIRGDGEWGTIDTLLEQLRALEIDLSKHHDDGKFLSA